LDRHHYKFARENLIMNDWLHNLPITWMALVVFGFTYLLTAGIYGFVTAGAKGERAHAFKAVSPGLLSPLAIIFGLFVAFTAAQVWKLARLELWWSSPLPFRVKLNRGCKPLSAATLSRSQLRSGR
jgi:hypothetical protein